MDLVLCTPQRHRKVLFLACLADGQPKLRRPAERLVATTTVPLFIRFGASSIFVVVLSGHSDKSESVISLSRFHQLCQSASFADFQAFEAEASHHHCSTPTVCGTEFVAYVRRDA